MHEVVQVQTISQIHVEPKIGGKKVDESANGGMEDGGIHTYYRPPPPPNQNKLEGKSKKD